MRAPPNPTVRGVLASTLAQETHFASTRRAATDCAAVMLNRAQQRDGELAILRNEIMRSRFECDHLQLTNDELRVKADRMLGKAPSLSVASFVESESFVETTVVEAGTESSTKTAHGGGASGGGRSHRDFGTGVKLNEEEVRSIEFAIGDPIAAGVELADLKTDLRGINLEAEKTVRLINELREKEALRRTEQEAVDAKRLMELRKQLLFDRHREGQKKGNTTKNYEGVMKLSGERRVICIPKKSGAPRVQRTIAEELRIQAIEGNAAFIAELFEHGATVDDMNTRDATGATPMIHAVRGGFLDVVALLVEKGAAANICTSRGNSALHCAYALFENGPSFPLLVQLLLQNGASTTVKNSFGKTPAERQPKSSQE